MLCYMNSVCSNWLAEVTSAVKSAVRALQRFLHIMFGIINFFLMRK